MKCYLVHRAVKVKDKNGNFLDVPQNNLAVAGDIESRYKYPDGMKLLLDVYIHTFTNYEDAVQVAKFRASKSKMFAFPVFEIDCKTKGGESSIIVNGKKFSTINTTNTQYDILSGSLEHVNNKKYKKVDISKIKLSVAQVGKMRVMQNRQYHEDRLQQIHQGSSTSLSLASHAVAASAIATGFFLGTVVSLLETGIAISAGSFAIQIAISATMGLLAVAAANAAWYVGKSIYHWFLGTESKPKSKFKPQPITDEERYNRELTGVNAHIKELEKESVNCKTIINTFNDLIKKAGNPRFDDKGMCTIFGQPLRNVLQIARWKEKRLEQIKNISTNKRKCATLKKEITDKARHKMEKPYHKPTIFS